MSDTVDRTTDDLRVLLLLLCCLTIYIYQHTRYFQVCVGKCVHPTGVCGGICVVVDPCESFFPPNPPPFSLPSPLFFSPPPWWSVVTLPITDVALPPFVLPPPSFLPLPTYPIPSSIPPFSLTGPKVQKCSLWCYATRR